jgi:Bacterial PH domain
VSGEGTSGAAGQGDLHRPFRSVRGRRVATGVAVVQAVVFLVVAFVPVWGDLDFGWFDRLGFLLVAAGVGWVLSRFASVAAHPRPDGVDVRNLLTRRDLEWAEIVGVRFADGDPWVTVDLSDGDTLAVMAIQRADGEHGRAEARRLSTLVALHSRTERDD